MALKYAGIAVEHREIALREKPKSMLLASPKGTVPVLCVGDRVLDQSLDILHGLCNSQTPRVGIRWIR
jgi:glutathione S-transferase